jgi:hypothetical protein
LSRRSRILERIRLPVPNAPEPSIPVTPEEFRAMARIAGLTVDDDRLPEVLAELNAQIDLARSIEPLATGTEAPAFAPYDPAFPEIRLEDPA